MENSEVFEKGKVKNLIKDLQMRASTLRDKTITKNTKSVTHLVKNGKKTAKTTLNSLDKSWRGLRV